MINIVLIAQTGWRVTSNPVSLTPVIREYERTRERMLSEDRLRAFWKALDANRCGRPTLSLRSHFGWLHAHRHSVRPVTLPLSDHKLIYHRLDVV